MLRKYRITALALLGGLLIGVAMLWAFRVAVIQATAGMFLDDDQVRITALRNVRMGRGGASVAELDILLPASGLRLSVDDITLDYSLSGLIGSGTVESLEVAAMELTQVAPLPGQTDTSAPGLRLSDMLLLFREFPLQNLQVSDLTIPGRTEPLALNLRQEAGNVDLGINSGTLELLITLNQPIAAGTAQLELALNDSGATVAGAAVTLTAAGDAYQLSGTGHADIPDVGALLGAALAELLALPLTAVQLDLELTGEISNAFLDTAPTRVALNVAAGSTLAMPDDLVTGLGALALLFPDTAVIELETGTTTAITGTVPLSATGSWQQQPFNAMVVFNTTGCMLAASEACEIRFEGNADLAAVTFGASTAGSGATAGATATGTTLSAPGLTGSGSVVLGNGGMQATLNPESRLFAAGMASAALASGPLSLTTVAPLTLNSAAGEPVVTVAGAELSGTLERLVAAGYTVDTGLTLRNIAISAGAVVTGTLGAATHGFTVSGPQPWLPAVDVDASLELVPGRISFTTPLIFRDAPATAGIVASGAYDIASGSADAKLALPPLLLDGEGKSLSAYLGGWPWPFDVMTGSLEAVLDLQWQPAAAASAGTLTGTLSGALAGAAGFYGDLFFRGLDSELSASLDTSRALPVNTPPLTLAIAAIDVGLPVSNVAVDYRIDADAQAMHIASFHGEVLGGSLSGENVVYDFTSARNLLNLRFTGLRLDHMLTLAEYEGVEATGAVSGMLPIVITPNGVEVEAGTLFAEAPGGTIHYLGGATSGGNLGVDLVNQALSNYQFESLESSIDYRPDGELVLEMKMQGRNPDMNDGQRINLNLNLSDNIPALLESLQAGRAIEDFVQGQYDRQAAP